MVVGTWSYMPPEYLQFGHISVKTDAYAFGIVLMELLTGLSPIDALQEKVKEALHLKICVQYCVCFY